MIQSKSIFISIVLIFCFSNLSAKLNDFGISNIQPSKKSSSKKYIAFDQRILEEMGDNITLQIILKFIPKIEAYFQHLLNTDNQDPQALSLVKFAILDVKKARKMIEIENIDPREEHELRIALRKLDKKVNLYKK